MLFARVVHQNVEPSESTHRLVDHPPALVLVADVGAESNEFAAQVFDQALGLARVVVFLEVNDRNSGALLRCSDRYRAPDTAISARDQNSPILQFVGPAVLGTVAERLRLHLGLNARLMILMLRRKRRCLFGCRHNTDLIAVGRRIKLSFHHERFYARLSSGRRRSASAAPTPAAAPASGPAK